MTKFIQIGNVAFNIASINKVDFSSREASVRIDYGSSGEKHIVYLQDNASRAFKDWWDKKANVYYIDPNWFDKDHLSNWEDEKDREA